VSAARPHLVPTAVPDAVPPSRPVPVPPSRTERPEAVPAGSSSSRTLAEEFAAEIAAGRIPGVKRIQRRMGGSQDTAYKHQAALRALAGLEPAPA
jgi:hypothetical protein